ncbi:uncharacterized protein LOC134277769 [Saccostrea cucullata]|uniref:uncharacterized protein LOC134277769 n=1 Tax=Saccostrea cuccullata TaxID=36930 RepID=UPI002ED26158
MSVYAQSCFVFCFTAVLRVESHSLIKGNVQSLLKLTPWNWKHLNTSVKVDTPVSVDISVLSQYRLTGKHFNKYQHIQRSRDCSAILKSTPHTKGTNGVYVIYPDLKTKKLVYCDMTTEGGGWTVIQRRLDGSVDFYRSWKSYKEGFGNAEGEYWLGNEVIHSLTTKTKQELRVDLQNFSNKKAFAKYSTFSLGSESQKYKLTVGGYSGTAGDSLRYHNGRGFSTKDQDNDLYGKSCAVVHKAAWWFHSCEYSDLNGPYHKSAVKSWASVVWYYFGNDNRSMKFARMMIRLKIFAIPIHCIHNIVGNVQSLLKLTPWNWKHLNTSVKVDTPVSVDISVLSHYRLTGKHFNKYQHIQRSRDCSAILKSIPHTKGRNGVYVIYPDLKTKKLPYCDMPTEGGGWTVIQRRLDGSVDFYRSWNSYKEGFGNAEGEYWLGNEVIHLLTTKTKQELRVDLQNFSDKKAFAKYSTFSVGSESQKYKLTVDGYSGTAGDSLKYHNGRGFSTKDQDNDSDRISCAVERKAGWWFKSCQYSLLTGPYHKSAVKSWASVLWYYFGNDNRSMKFARMMIRPKS